MKTIWFVVVLSISAGLVMEAQTDPPSGSNALALVRMSPLTRRAIAPAAEVVALWTNQIGQVYWQTNAVKVSRESEELIELVPGGAIARKGPFRVNFTADINTQGAIDITFDGNRLRSTPVSLAYWDSVSGKSVLLAQIKSSVGEVLPDNRIIYQDAFDGSGVRADVLYTFRAGAGSFEQDIVIRSQQLPDPAAFGLAPESTRILAMTEFYDAPDPVAVPRLIKAETKGDPLGTASTETLTDQTLIFGSKRLVTGKAFTLGNAGTYVPVIKTWQNIGGRTFLIESTPYRLLKAQLDVLPRGSAQMHPGSSRAPRLAASLSKILPAKQTRRVSPGTIRLAQNAVTDTPGVVLDYVLLHNQVTYLINVDFGAGSESEEVGWAAMGKSDSDFWNYYTRDDGQGGYLYYGELENLVLSMGGSTPVKLTLENAPGAWGNGHSDPMFGGYLYPFDSGNITLTVTNLPPGYYDFYLYGHGPGDDNNSAFELGVGGNSVGTQSTTTNSGWSSETWTEGQQYVLFTNVAVGATNLLIVTVQPDGVSYAHINGLQIASTPGVDPPTVSVIATNDGTQCLVTIEHAQADDFLSPVNTNTYANATVLLVTNTCCDSFCARQTNHNRSVSEGVFISQLPALVISPNGGYFNYPSNVTITLGFENLTNLVEGLYHCELERQVDAEGIGYWASYAQGLRNAGYLDESIRTNLINNTRSNCSGSPTSSRSQTAVIN